MSFAEWQPRYAAAGLATIPIRDKRPAIRNWLKFGLRAGAKATVNPRFAEMAIGVLVGPRNRLTVLDVDSPDEDLLGSLLLKHGETPVVVRTASGKFHLWYANNNEPRHIRVYGAEPPVDLLGRNSFAVAPPSITPRGVYRFIRGGLQDVHKLPVIKGLDHLQPRARSTLNVIDQKIGATPQGRLGAVLGERNRQLFRACLQQAPEVNSIDELLNFARQLNSTFQPPLGENEVLSCVKSSWKYQVHNRNVYSEGVTPFERLRRHGGRAVSDAYYLHGLLERSHSNRNCFALAKVFASRIGWGETRFRNARRTLEEAEIIRCLHRGGCGPHDPPIYEWCRGQGKS